MYVHFPQRCMNINSTQSGYQKMMGCLWIRATVVLLVLATTLTPAVGFKWDEWWKNTIVYQIYPRSFMDSDGDGVGDLAGITSRLEYFNDIGVGTIWLNPVYKSPMADFGYDISDFEDIDPIFGTMADFDALINKAHQLGLRLLMDFVPNHTSDQHQWFVESRKNKASTNPYKDYYVWVDPKQDCSDPPQQCIPSNWASIFGGSVWEWEPERQQFYLHQFLKEQPDLNYSNPQVRAEIDDVLRFWLSKGVDGLRMDATRHLYENEQLEDEPMDPEYPIIPGEHAQYYSLLHTQTVDLPKVYDDTNHWREILDEFSDNPNFPGYRLMVVEVYNSHKALLPYYGTSDRRGADFPFNFGLLYLNKENRMSGIKIHKEVKAWMEDLPPGKWPNWVIGNHDNFRIADRLGIKYARAMNALNLLLPGTPTSYYGEEIGMENIRVTLNTTRDPFAINNPNHWENYTRDPERSPMQWDRSHHAGFSTTTGDTWLPVKQNYLSGVNVADQMADNTSSLALYMKLAALRKEEPAFHTNHLKYVIVTEKIFSFLRMPDTPGLDSFLVIVNAGTSNSTDDYSAALKKMMVRVEDGTGVIVVMSSNMDRNGKAQSLDNVHVASGEAIVIRASVYVANSEPASTLSPFLIVATMLAGIFSGVVFRYYQSN